LLLIKNEKRENSHQIKGIRETDLPKIGENTCSYVPQHSWRPKCNDDPSSEHTFGLKRGENGVAMVNNRKRVWKWESCLQIEQWWQRGGLPFWIESNRPERVLSPNRNWSEVVGGASSCEGWNRDRWVRPWGRTRL